MRRPGWSRSVRSRPSSSPSSPISHPMPRPATAWWRTSPRTSIASPPWRRGARSTRRSSSASPRGDRRSGRRGVRLATPIRAASLESGSRKSSTRSVRSPFSAVDQGRVRPIPRARHVQKAMCHYCGKRELEASSCASVSSQMETGREYYGNTTRIHYQVGARPVARCPRATCAGTCDPWDPRVLLAHGVDRAVRAHPPRELVQEHLDPERAT